MVKMNTPEHLGEGRPEGPVEGNVVPGIRKGVRGKLDQLKVLVEETPEGSSRDHLISLATSMRDAKFTGDAVADENLRNNVRDLAAAVQKHLAAFPAAKFPDEPGDGRQRGLRGYPVPGGTLIVQGERVAFESEEQSPLPA